MQLNRSLINQLYFQLINLFAKLNKLIISKKLIKNRIN